MRSISVKLYLVLSLSLFFSGCGYNRLVRFEKDLQDSWSSLESQFRERDRLSTDLVILLKKHSFHHPALLDQLEIRKGQVFPITVILNRPDTMDLYMEAQVSLADELAYLIQVASSYPHISADESYRKLLGQWRENNQRIEEQLNHFEENLWEYNRYIDRWPRSFVAQLLGFQPYEEKKIEASTILLQLP